MVFAQNRANWNIPVYSMLYINWVAPCKPAQCDYFVAIFQVAPNRLKFGMSTLFVLKNVPVYFFSRMQNNTDKIASNSTPPSLSVSKQRRISIFEGQNTVRVCFTLLEEDWGGGGGGVREGRGVGELSRMCLKPCLPACEKRSRGTFFNTKRVEMPNFSRLSNLENRYEIVTWGRLARSPSIMEHPGV